MLTVEVPPTYPSERLYALSLLLEEFLGLTFCVSKVERRATRIHRNDGRELIIADELFQISENQWLRPASLPIIPLQKVTTRNLPISFLSCGEELPILYGNEPYLEFSDDKIRLGVDIFGSAFFMLTRYEEVANGVYDRHNRFPFDASIVKRANLVARPIVNEYIELLWACISKLWPDLRRKTRAFQAHVSHDVDWVSFRRQGLPNLLRSSAIDVIKRRDPLLALQRVASTVHAARDVYDTFDFIMDQSEKAGLKSAFYFIPSQTGGEFDGDYTLDDPWIRQLLRTIHARGHEIGLHSSYESFRDPDQIRNELKVLQRICDEEKISQHHWGGRQHYLRWEAPFTWQNWEDAGLKYDSTVGFAEHAGFRAGICYEYPVYNLIEKRPLRLRERPLIVMETTFLQYSKGGTQAAQAEAQKLAQICRKFEGDFTLLWHNNSLSTRQARVAFSETLSYL